MPKAIIGTHKNGKTYKLVVEKKKKPNIRNFRKMARKSSGGA